MPYSNDQLLVLQKALATGEKRVTFGDKTIEYRTVDELKAAIREIELQLARDAGRPRTRQIRVTTGKGF